MKGNKKGFTLIELLAVLVVLAILALIAVPIVLNIIQQSREKSHLRSVEGFAKAVESSVYTYMMDNSDASYSSLSIDGSNGTWVLKSGTTVVANIEYSGNPIVKCTLDTSELTTNNKIKLTACGVTNDENIIYENGAAKPASQANNG